MKDQLTKLVIELDKLKGISFKAMKSKDFEDFIVSLVSKYSQKVQRQFIVSDRGDGKKGRIDIVAVIDYRVIGFEIDWKSPRIKSLFKLKMLKPHKAFSILREPFSIEELL